MVTINKSRLLTKSHGTSSNKHSSNTTWSSLPTSWKLAIVVTCTVLLNLLVHEFLISDICATTSDAAASSPILRIDPQAAQAVPPLQEDACRTEYRRITAKRTPGLTTEDLKRSLVYSGNRHRLMHLVQKLQAKTQPITAVVSGGSISLGHGVMRELRYSNRLETWLNEYYPLPPSASQHHQVLNKGSHGADMCAMAKRLNILVDDLPTKDIDLFVLEFAVNDYQGQDHKIQIDFKMDMFFDGFQQIAMCTETVLYKLLQKYPNAAVIFLEMRTAILARKTASLLHLGAAQHYQVPVLSYDQAIFPHYQQLLQILKPFNYSTAKGDTVLPYPFGCHACIPDHIIPSFRAKGCASVCRIQQFAESPLECKQYMPANREPCTVPFFAHDEVHPSGIGHQIAMDIIVEAIASTGRDSCRATGASGSINKQANDLDLQAVVPWTGWMVSNPQILDLQQDFLMVNDTYEIFVKKRPLQASQHSPGFSLFEDKFDRYGWISTNPGGGEYAQFDFQFPQQTPQGKPACYVPYLSVLKSYEKMGTFTVMVRDFATQLETTMEVDGLWTPHISVPSDIQLVQDNAMPVACTGHCAVIVRTHPETPGRGGNKVKIVTLSVRKCLPS